MSKQIRFFFLALLCPTIVTAQAGASQISQLHGCYFALQGYNDYESSVINKTHVLVPAKRDNQRGFYIYNETTSYFCALPASPASIDNGYDRYSLQLDINGQNTAVNYTIHRASQYEKFEVTHKSASQPVLCRSALDETSKNVISEYLKKRVENVHSHFASTWHFQDLRYNKQIKPDGHKEALEKCHGAGGVVGQAAQVELGKFKIAQQTLKRRSAPQGAR